MTLQISRKLIIQLSIILVLLISAFVFTYLLVVNPVKAKISQLENSVKTEERLLELITEKRTNEAPVVSSTEIQKKIPVIPLVEQIVLDIERAETLSESRVLNMSYGESEFMLNPEGQSEEQENAEGTETETETNQDDTANEASSTEETDTIIDPELIDGLSQVVVTLSVESPNYLELEKFLSVVEHQTRITKVDALSFTGTSELTSVEQVPAPLVYNVTISAFYMPKYAELAEEAPKLTVPPPSKKNNPLATGLEGQSGDKD
ncbi:hypothetical protein [Ferdinandcohnia sp. Marseille-Q9671]